MHAKPQPLVLKARTVTDLLDAAVGLYRHNFGTLLGVVALVHGPLLALQVVASGLWGWSSGSMRSGGLPGAGGIAAMLGGMGALSLVWVATLILQPLSSGAMVLSVSDLYLGRQVTIKEAYRRAMRSWGPLIGAQLLVQLIVGFIGLGPGMILFVAGGMLLAAKAAVAGGLVIVLGLVLMLCLMVAAYVCLLATVPAIVVENRGVGDALTRSFRLVSRGWRHALAAWALLGLLVAIPVLVAYVPAVLAQVRGAATGVSMTSALASGLVSLAALLLMPVTLAGQVVIYYDLRVRQEGFDLEMMAANLGLKAAGAEDLPPPVAIRREMPPPPPPPPPPVPPPPPPSPTGAEENLS